MNNLNCSIAEKYIQSLASLVPFVMCHLHMNTSMEPCNDTMNARQTEQLLSMPQEWFWNINFIMLSWRLKNVWRKCQGWIGITIQYLFWPSCMFALSLYTLNMRRCQIEVQFESGARTKFLVALFQPMTSISDHKSVPWFHSFQNMYNTHMCKMNTEVEKLGFSKKIYLVLMKKCKKK